MESIPWSKSSPLLPILMHWVPDTQLVMETDALDYTLATILSIMTKDNEIHPVAFYS